MTKPTNPQYRLLGANGEEEFSHTVSEALQNGWELHGPSFNAEDFS